MTTSQSQKLPASTAARSGLLLGSLILPTAVGLSSPAVALPAIGRDLSLGPAQLSWVLAAFALALAVATPSVGRVIDQRGPRSGLIFGASLLLLGTALCVLSWSFASLVVGRFLQGLGGGATSVVGFTLAAGIGHETDRRRVLAVLMTVVGTAAGSGILLGGVLEHAWGWRSVLAVPLTALPFAARVATLPSGTHATGGRLDVRGLMLTAVTVATATFIVQAPTIGVDPRIVGMLLVLLMTIAWCGVRHQRRLGEDAFVPPSLMRHPAMRFVAASGASLFAAYATALLLAPLLLAGIGWSALGTGVLLLPAGLAAGLASKAGRELVGHVQPRRVVVLLGIVATGSLGAAGLAPGHALASLTAVTGTLCGFVVAQVVLLDVIGHRVPVSQRGLAVGIFNLSFLLGAAVATSVVGGLAERFDLPTAALMGAPVPLVACVAVARLSGLGKPEVPDVT